MKQLFTSLVLCITTIAFSQANTKLSNLVSPTAVNQHLLPNTTNARDLGSSTYAWKSAYFRGYIYLDGTRFISNAPGTGNANAFVGSNAGVAVTTGYKNTATGHYALYKLTTAYANTAVGAFSLYNNTSGHGNAALGTNSLYFNTTGYWNTALGDSALYSNSDGGFNSAVSTYALYSNTNGYYNVAMGVRALYANTNGYSNTAIGEEALSKNTTARQNTAVGIVALQNNSTGSYNVAIGSEALINNVDGSSNTAVGRYAGPNNGSAGTYLGSFTYAVAGFTNATAVGYGATVDASNKVRIGNTSVTSIGGQVGWTVFSDGRFKQNIREDVHGLDFINSLRPITYTVDVKGLNDYYNKGRAQQNTVTKDETLAALDVKAEAEAGKIIYNGFIAQDVEKAAQKLQYSFSGVDKPQNSEGLYGLRYSDFVVPLVKAVQELDAKTKQIEALQQKNEQLEQRLQRLEGLLGTSTVTSTAAYLEQNTPNPVRSSTTIRYYIPESTISAMLNLTNTKGQLIKAVSLNRGNGQVSLNTTVLASGTYNYTLFVDGKQVASKRLVIVH